jgi:4-hydroxy-tetrahydrodipicolinate synthase
MSLIKGIYAASLSVINENLSLNIGKTIKHAENIIDYGCHGVVFLGSTGQSQLISLCEKIQLINELPKSKHKNKFIIGTGSNSLSDTIALMRISMNLGFNKFLIMPPAYYKYEDSDVINFYSKIINELKECRIILYNFEKLCGYKFSVNCIEKLVSKFPNQIIGVKDSSYNLYENLRIENFSILPGSESKLIKGLKLGCTGIITATCNVTANLSRKVYDDFNLGEENNFNELLCNVRNEFDNYNLISALHSYFSIKDKIYQNLIPPLGLLNSIDNERFINNLNNMNFSTNDLRVI